MLLNDICLCYCVNNAILQIDRWQKKSVPNRFIPQNTAIPMKVATEMAAAMLMTIVNGKPAASETKG